jgi:hypothetical protein
VPGDILSLDNPNFRATFGADVAVEIDANGTRHVRAQAWPTQGEDDVLCRIDFVEGFDAQSAGSLVASGGPTNWHTVQGTVRFGRGEAHG